MTNYFRKFSINTEKTLYTFGLLSAIGLRFLLISLLFNISNNVVVLFNYSALWTSLWPYLTIGLTFIFSSRLPVVLHYHKNQDLEIEFQLIRLFQIINYVILAVYLIIVVVFSLNSNENYLWILIFLGNICISHGHLFLRSLSLKISAYGYLIESTLLVICLIFYQFLEEDTLGIYVYFTALNVVLINLILYYLTKSYRATNKELNFDYLKKLINEGIMRLFYNLNVYLKDNLDLLIVSFIILINKSYGEYYKYIFYSSAVKILVSIIIATKTVSIAQKGSNNSWTEFYSGEKKLKKYIVPIIIGLLLTIFLTSLIIKTGNTLFFITLFRSFGILLGIPMMLYVAKIIQLKEGNRSELRRFLIPQAVIAIVFTILISFSLNQMYMMYILSFCPIIISLTQLWLLKKLDLPY